MLAKKLTPERVTVSIEEGKLTVTIRDEAGQQEYDLSTQLYGAIDVAESRWELLSTKVMRHASRCRTCIQCPFMRGHPAHPAIYTGQHSSVPIQFVTYAAQHHGATLAGMY